MLERKRKSKHYDIVPGGEGDVEGGQGLERDVELGEGVGGQESGVLAAADRGGEELEGEAQAGTGAKRSVTEELDRWDENADDEWDEPEAVVVNDSAEVLKAGAYEEGKKRAD
jgi:hypothetical protein